MTTSNDIERWINVDGTILDVQPDGSGVTYRSTTRKGWGGRRGGEGYVSPENMRIVRSSPFWKQERETALAATASPPVRHSPTLPAWALDWYDACPPDPV